MKKLTNIQVPRDPKEFKYDALKKAPPINLDNYKNLGKVEEHKDTESVINKTIAKQESARGVKIDQKKGSPTSNLSMGGINDDRPKVYFKIYTKG